MRVLRTAATAVISLVMIASCGGCGSTTDTNAPTQQPSVSGASPLGTPAVSNRPASPAVISIVSPKDGSTVQGPMVTVTVAIQNAHIVQATTTNIKPDEGHVHLYIDGNLQYMAYTLSQSFTVPKGTVQLYAEFVASDHFPFNPRVKSPVVVFTVT